MVCVYRRKGERKRKRERERVREGGGERLTSPGKCYNRDTIELEYTGI